MAGEWPVAQLGDVVDLVTGYPFESQRYTDDPTAPRLLRGDNVAQGALRWDGAKRWPADDSAGLDNYWLREADVILAMDRPWIDAGLKYAAVRDSDLPALLVQRVARLRGTAQLHTRFLKYVIGSRAFTEHVTAVQTGTAVPHISGGQIRSFEFPLPPLPEQRAIAHILGTLDDKIELNRRMNETLEAIARALFKSWFVDFDPVRAKAEGRDPGLPAHLADLFPDSIEDSELGEIPKGWRVVKTSDLATFSRDALTPGGFPDEEFGHYSIPAFDDGRRPSVETGGSIKSTKFLVPAGSVLVSKLNPRIRRIWMPTLDGSRRAICSTEFLVMLPRVGVSREFLFCLFASEAFADVFETLVTGTSGSHQRVQPDGLLAMDVAIPGGRLIQEFTDMARPLLVRANSTLAQSGSLATLRDTLLPKLVSGEMRVPSARRGAPP